MKSEKINKKTAEEGKNIKNKKKNTVDKKPKADNTKTKTSQRSDVNSDVDQE